MAAWTSLRFDFEAMAAPCSIQVDAQDETGLREAVQAAIDEVHRIELKYSRYRESSVVGEINRAAGGEPVSVDAETAALLDFAQQLWELSEGLFDVTSGILRRAWDFRGARMPAPGQLEALLDRVGWASVQWRAPHIRLPLAGMEVDFGGFGKEYAADRAAAVLLARGFTHALVNLGGDIHAVGPRGLPGPDDSWHVAIQHPRPAPGDSQASLASLPLRRGGLATSGDYERYFERDGRRYCHILDPRTGWPVSHWQSVSVLAANTTTAGALSTIAMLMGEPAPGWLAAQEVRYLAVGPDGSLNQR